MYLPIRKGSFGQAAKQNFGAICPLIFLAAQILIAQSSYAALPISATQTTDYDGLGITTTVIMPSAPIPNGTAIDDLTYTAWDFDSFMGTSSVFARSGITSDPATTPTRITTSDSSNFSVTSIAYIVDIGGPSPTTANMTLSGYRDGTLVETEAVSLANSSSGTITLNWGAVDEIRLSGNTNFVFFDNLITGLAVSLNTTPAISINNATLAHLENAAAVQIDAAATVSDADGDADWNGGSLRFQMTANQEAGDELSISDTDADSITITVSGTNIFANMTDIGDLSVSGGTVTNATAQVITFDSDASNAIVQEVLRSIRYRTTSDEPITSNKVVSVTATDNSSASSIDTRTIQVTRQNEPPVYSGVAANPTHTAGGTPSPIFSSFTGTAVESGQNLDLFILDFDSVADLANEFIHVDGTRIPLGMSASGATATNNLLWQVQGTSGGLGSNILVILDIANSGASFSSILLGAAYENSSTSPTTSPNRTISLISVGDDAGSSNSADDVASSPVIASTITILPPNVAPVITEGTSTSVTMDEDSSPTAFALTLNATDSNNDTLTWSISSPASNGTAATSGSGSSKAITYTPTANYNGSDSFTVSVSDGALSDTITVNVTVTPVADISSSTVPAAANYGLADTLFVVVNFDEAVTVTGTPSIPLTIGSTIRNATLASGNGTSSLTFSYAIQSTDLDTNGISVGSLNVASVSITNASGNNAVLTNFSPGGTAGVLVDGIQPIPTLSTTAGDPISGAFSLNVSFDKSVSGFTVADINATNAALSTFSDLGSGNYSVLVTPQTDGVLTLQVPINIASDANGNANIASNSLSLTFDATRPTPTLSSTSANPLNSAFTLNMSFDEVVSGFTMADINATNATVGTFSDLGSGSYSALITPQTDGLVTVQIAAGLATDSANNTNVASNTLSRTYDATQPIPNLSTAVASPINSAFTLSVSFGETVSGFTAMDINATNATVGTLSDLGSGNYNALITPQADGAVTLQLSAGIANDAANNTNLISNVVSLTFDSTGPSGHTIAWDDASISSANEANTSFTLANAEQGSSFAYSISSAGDTTVVSGTGSIPGSGGRMDFQVANLDISNLADGMLTLSAVVTDPLNNAAPAVVANITKDTTAPTVVNLLPSNGTMDVPGTSTFTITLSETVIATSANASISLVETQSNHVAASALLSDNSMSISGSTLIWQPTVLLSAATTYHIVTSSNPLQDNVGNVFAGISDAQTWQFTTVDNRISTAPDSISLSEDTSIFIDVLSNDDVVTNALDISSLALTTQPINGRARVVGGGQFIEYTPDSNYNGNDALSYQVANRSGIFSSETMVSVDVRPLDDAPVANPDTGATITNTPVTIAVLINDNHPDSSNTITAETLQIVTEPTNGIVDIIDAAVRYTPNMGFVGTDSFQYNVADNQVQYSNITTAMIVVTSSTTSVTATDDSASINEDTAIDIDVTANDSSTSGTVDTTTVQIIAPPSNGSAIVNATTGIISYIGNANYFGDDHLRYVVFDSLGNVSNIASVDITVLPVNDAPMALADSALFNANQSKLVNVVGNDSDIDSLVQNASISITSAASGGSTRVTTTPMGRTMINYVPGANTTSDSFEYQIIDDANGISNSVAVTLGSTTSNMAPTAIAPMAINDRAQTNQNTPISIDVITNDVAANNDIDTTTLSIVTVPQSGTAVFESNGNILYSPSATFVGDDTITYQVSDTNGTISNIATVRVRVVSFPDLDGDGIPNSIDEDIDGDQISNADELSNGLNPNDPNDADADSDGDGISNREEIVAGLDPTTDSVAPIVQAPENLTIIASNLFTTVVLGSATATDMPDGNLVPMASQVGPFQSGRQQITWSAVDAAGNRGEAIQTIDILPLTQVTADISIGEGSTLDIPIQLSGPAPQYPVDISYSVSGSATAGEDHNLTSGTLSITNGTQGILQLTTSATDASGEADETLVLTLDSANGASLGQRTVQTITITENNLAPTVAITVMQNATLTRTITPDLGPVTVTASVRDGNSSDTHTFDWMMSDSELMASAFDGAQFIFDPSNLSAGTFNLNVAISDNGAPTMATEAQETVLVVLSLAPLSATTDTDTDGHDDVSEGYNDVDQDGIPDYVDAISHPRFMQVDTSATPNRLLMTSPGLNLSVGNLALALQNHGAGISTSQISANLPADNSHINSGGFFDFRIEGLSNTGQSAAIVIPLAEAIPADASWRKFDGNTWHNFVVDEQNQLRSAALIDDFCPPPGHSTYRSGLIPGNVCVELLIEDGGPNDADGAANGSIQDPSGLTTGEPFTEIVPPLRRRGGGGALSWESLGFGFVLLVSLAYLRHRRQIRPASLR